MKATIVQEIWDDAGNFVGQVLVENGPETWSSLGVVCFKPPVGGHTKATIKTALKDYAAAHQAICDAAIAKNTPPNINNIDAIVDDASEIPISNAARKLRKALNNTTP